MVVVLTSDTTVMNPRGQCLGAGRLRNVRFALYEGFPKLGVPFWGCLE